ncbi:MAG: aminotransferase class I/II-fold pyridoxal phosphate-dependent enzyme [Candidatus Melainabacteria bacterium]|nr:aminotransferase class I/II-fold pyridoxal phosphate-dependent enzyme [Candidatus Melainabacteria bacterium]
MVSETLSYPKIIDAYDATKFKQRAEQVVAVLADYLSKVDELPVLKWQDPQQAIESWRQDFSEGNQDLESLVKKFIEESNHLHSPRYAGHQVTTPIPTAALAELAYSFLNSPSTIYEMGPASYGIEQAIVCWLAEKLYIDTDKAGAVLTSGGSLGNLTALLAARQTKAGYDVWNEGVKDDLAIMVSDQNHYSVTRAAHVMGLGSKSIYFVPSDENFKLKVDELEQVYQQTQADDKRVIAVCASACSTATGAYDDLNSIADFCEANDLWLHVDGAHGASVALSERYKHLIAGINRADSVVWDAHKMMAIPSLITAVIYKNRSESYATFSQDASYLLDQNSIERDTCNRTVECTKPNMAMKLYLSLAIHGEEFFSDYIDATHDLAKDFAKLIQEQTDFELAIEPESNIVCFRYSPKELYSVQNKLNTVQLNSLQVKIRESIIKSGEFYFVKTDLRGKTYLRVSLMNPLTKIEDLQKLLELIRNVEY